MKILRKNRQNLTLCTVIFVNRSLSKQKFFRRGLKILRECLFKSRISALKPVNNIFIICFNYLTFPLLKLRRRRFLATFSAFWRNRGEIETAFWTPGIWAAFYETFSFFLKKEFFIVKFYYLVRQIFSILYDRV